MYSDILRVTGSNMKCNELLITVSRSPHFQFNRDHGREERGCQWKRQIPTFISLIKKDSCTPSQAGRDSESCAWPLQFTWMFTMLNSLSQRPRRLSHFLVYSPQAELIKLVSTTVQVIALRSVQKYLINSKATRYDGFTYRMPVPAVL